MSSRTCAVDDLRTRASCNSKVLEDILMAIIKAHSIAEADSTLHFCLNGCWIVLPFIVVFGVFGGGGSLVYDFWCGCCRFDRFFLSTACEGTVGLQLSIYSRTKYRVLRTDASVIRPLPLEYKYEYVRT